MSETCPLCGRYCGIVSACVASVAQDASIERLERIVALKLEMMELRTANAKLLAACEAVQRDSWFNRIHPDVRRQLAAAIREGRG